MPYCPADLFWHGPSRTALRHSIQEATFQAGQGIVLSWLRRLAAASVVIRSRTIAGRASCNEHLSESSEDLLDAPEQAEGRAV